MAYYNPDHYGGSISTPYYEEEDEEDSPPRKQKNKENRVVDSGPHTSEQNKPTRKKSVIKNIEKIAEGQTPIIEVIEHYSDQFEDKGDD
ncbi:MAG: hypothetical protein ACTSQJ_01695 [Promethearchaeota archaeon]